MKKLFFTIISFFLFLLLISNPIFGQKKTETPKITEKLISPNLDGKVFVDFKGKKLPVPQKIIKTVLENDLSKKGIKVDYTNFELLKGLSMNGKTVYTVIRAYNKDKTIKTSIAVVDTGGGNTVNLQVDGGTCTCTTKTCSDTFGCQASSDNNTCICSTCTGECEKTSTSGFTSNVTAVITNGTKSY